MENKVKFYRCTELPKEGQPGGLYFVYGQNNYGLWVYTEKFEPYTPLNYLEHVSIAPELEKRVQVSKDTLILDRDTAIVNNNTMKISTVFAEVEDDKLIIKT